MKNKFRVGLMSMLAASLLVVSCDEDDANGPLRENEKTYTLAALDNSGVSGTVTFARENDATTRVTINLTGTMAGNSHPAHIHANSADADGPIVLDFNPVDGATGKSETMVTAFNDGKAVTYEELINYNGHVNVHKSATELAIMLAQGNIGSNATGSTPDAGDDGMDGDDGY